MVHCIAETDENGAVVCVWVAEVRSRSPRVFDREQHLGVMTTKAQFFGASRDEVIEWIEYKS